MEMKKRTEEKMAEKVHFFSGELNKTKQDLKEQSCKNLKNAKMCSSK